MGAKLFWTFAVATLGAMAAMLAGVLTLPIVVGFLFIAVVIAKTDNPGRVIGNLRAELSGRVGSIETSLSDIARRFEEEKGARELTLGALDRMKGEMQVEMKNGLDRMAERLIDFENGMNQMKRTFSAAVASLDDRVRILEPKLMEGGAPGLQPSEMIAPEVEEYVELDKSAQ